MHSALNNEQALTGGASSFFSSDLPSLADLKAAWYDLILHANRMEVLETWAGQFIQGTVIVTDGEGYPYVATRAEELENLRAGADDPLDIVQVLSLETPGVSPPGRIYLRSSIPLPPAQWPDFFTELVVACNLVIGRMEKIYDHLARQREHWIYALLEDKSIQQRIQDGYRLGLPVEQGQIWVIAWPTQTTPTALSARKKMLAESIVLDYLKSPLLFFGEDMGIILLDEHAQEQPYTLYDALLKQYAPYPLWMVYGARYHSLYELKMLLTHAITIAQRARREVHEEYLIDMQTPGLEYLLENPRLTEDLRNFAAKLLAPLIEYDNVKGSQLTTTFVLVQTLGSTQTVADQLCMHVNTVRYRLRKAEDLLGIDHASPKDRIAWALAAFVWKHLHLLEHL
jgi:sugar diacid utilization regulator